MPYRKLLIQVMLWSLAGTAIMGAFSAVMGAGTAGWRFVGTGVALAIAAGLMIPFAVRADKPETRLEGLAGMTLVILIFCAVLGLIWNLFVFIGGDRMAQRVGTSILFLAASGLPGVTFLRLVPKPGFRLGGWAGITLALVTFTILMIATWTGRRYGEPDEEWALTGLAVGGLGLLGVLSLMGVGKEPSQPWRWIGVGASAVAVAMAVFGIWQDERSDFPPLLAVVISLAAVVAHANICMLVPLGPGQEWIRWPTILAAMATAVFLDCIAFASIGASSRAPMLEKAASASGILAGCGTLGLIVLARLNKQLDRKPELSNITDVTVICPGCENKQSIPTGKDTPCTTCGLVFNVLVAEPRCPQCDYLLFKLQSDHCPECGADLKKQAPVAVLSPRPA